jgi:alkylresorcinol/alkylpyrone synthase
VPTPAGSIAVFGVYSRAQRDATNFDRALPGTAARDTLPCVSRIAAVVPALPPHRYAQSEIVEALLPFITDDPTRQALMRRLHASCMVDTRHLIMPLEEYINLGPFHATNDLFMSAGADLAERATGEALAACGLAGADVDFLLFTTVTGVAAPSLDAVIAARLGMRSDLKRLPSFGLGCVAGASGIARTHDYLQGHPDEVAVLVSVELCSLTVQRGDDSVANLVASGLFGDGAAAVVMVGDERAARLGIDGPAVVASRSALYPDTGDVLGWDIGGTGFKIVLGAGVPSVIEHNFAGDALRLLAENGLGLADIDVWMAHPGGPKVLEAFEHALELPDDALAPSWRSLAAVGNLSSAAVLHVLADVLDTGQAPDTNGLLFALGPGVTAELVLLRWPSPLVEEHREERAVRLETNSTHAIGTP